MKAQFEKRAYKELLEYCSDHLFDQKDETDPARRKLFKSMFTLDGQKLETLANLKAYCEEPMLLQQKKKVLIHDDDTHNLNDRIEVDNGKQFMSPASQTKIMHNKASFIFNPNQSELNNKDYDFKSLKSPHNLNLNNNNDLS